MKTLIFSERTELLLTALILLMGSSAFAQYSIDWYTVDGGGGTSSGGPYTLSGTIGQPDASVVSGGPYAITGGFWVAQSLAQPWLRIWIAGGNVVVAWPVSAGASQLQQSADLGAATWPAVPQTPAQVGGEYQVTLPLAGVEMFFRLVEL